MGGRDDHQIRLGLSLRLKHEERELPNEPIYPPLARVTDTSFKEAIGLGEHVATAGAEAKGGNAIQRHRSRPTICSELC